MAKALASLMSFLSDTRGTASMEFVVTLPLLLGPLILTAEYGQALSNREQLDSAVADATQLLAVAPAMPGSTEDDAPILIQHFVDKAEQIVADRLDVPTSAILFDATMTGDLTVTAGAPDGADRPFYLVEVRAAVQLRLGLLSFFNAIYRGEGEFAPETLPIVATDQARYISAVRPIDNISCEFNNINDCTVDITSVAAADGDCDQIQLYFPGICGSEVSEGE